jgi:hypothetical protein
MLMKKLILAVIMSLAIASAVKEAGAAACCYGSSMGAGIAKTTRTPWLVEQIV